MTLAEIWAVMDDGGTEMIRTGPQDVTAQFEQAATHLMHERGTDKVSLRDAVQRMLGQK